MSDTRSQTASRREFLTSSGRIAAASALAAGVVPQVHAAENNTLQVALIGCGGRGSGAAGDALSNKNGPIKLVAMADVFEKRLSGSCNALKERFRSQVDVPEDRKFIGFDAYRKAIDCLKAGDVAIFATPPAFRWVHFGYAIEKGVHVFMEKPVAVDAPTAAKMVALAEKAKQRNIKVGVGLMCRHCRARGELYRRIQDGAIGDIVALRAYRMQGRGDAGHKPKNLTELLWQIQRFHSFLWASGGCFSDFYIHHIDECCWMKGSWPVRAQACGGRHYRGDSVDQNLDTYSVEFTFGDGAKLFLYGRNMLGCHDEFASYAHGSKGLAVISEGGHSPARCRYYTGQNFAADKLVWRFGPSEPNPYRLEWDDLIDAIRQDRLYNEAARGAQASLVTAMGRMAAHTGQIVTYEQMLKLDHEFAPGVDKLTLDSPAPLLAGADGKYPVPQPGITTQREY
ncbi:MAG: Gfo/Idh/MocA family oxidoreductase [Thermoguttaceae bacterium]|jgi:predicted dehydrogenase